MCSMRRQLGWIDRDDRDPVNLSGRVVLGSGRSVAVTVVNMSPDGCKVECAETLPIAATVRLELGAVIGNAQIRWAIGGAAGLRLI